MVEPAGPKENERFAKDPSQALEQMMDKYGTTVLRTAYFYTKDQHLAEDVSQETFIRAYRHWKKFRGDSSVKTWLTRITVNVCRDKLGLKMSSEQPTEPEKMALQRTSNAEEEAMKRLEKTEILQHVLRMPEAYQEVLYMFYYLDLSTRDIAAAIQSPEGTVRGRLHRAREMLAQTLQEEELRHERA